MILCDKSLAETYKFQSNIKNQTEKDKKKFV